jgi:hypothetical protein
MGLRELLRRAFKVDVIWRWMWLRLVNNNMTVYQLLVLQCCKLKALERHICGTLYRQADR